MATRLDEISPAASGNVIDLLSKSVLFSVTMTKFGNRRQVNTSLVEVDADKAMIGVSKSLVDSKELKAIGSLDMDIRQYLYSRSVPSPLRGGIYLLPIALIGEVEDKMNAFTIERDRLVTLFAEAYDAQVQEARERLRSTFNISDYPLTSEIAGTFKLGWQYLSLSAPETLPPDIFKREQAKIAAQFAEAWDETRQILRAALAEQVKHAAERLSGGADGKPKVFRNTLLENLNDFIGSFDARNLTNDDELTKLVAQVRSLVDGVDPEILRKDVTVRESVAKGMAEIQANLDGMMIDKPRRLFRDE